MDFLDPKKQKAHSIRLAIGYAFIGFAVILATTILLYEAYGFGLDRNGRVIQNGLVFVSSQPSGANVYLNGKQYKDKTNTRITTPAGQYTMELWRDGYRTWKRAIAVEGGSVERFDYAFLFPNTLTTAVTKQYPAAPLLASQSADQRWLLVDAAATPNSFELYDLNASKPEPKTLAVPDDILAASTTTTGWQTVQWANDNRHVVLRRLYQKGTDSGSEYILFDRQTPEDSQNLSVLLGFTPTTIQLRGHNYDQYFAFDQNSGELFTATLKKPTPQAYLDKVLNFETDGNTVVYATAQDAPAGKVLLRIRQSDDTSHTLRQAPAGTTYLLDLASYKGKPYVAAGAQSEDKVYVYQDPIAALKNAANGPLVPVQILKTLSPTSVSFSPNARFVMAENADHFAVYDAETDKSYAFQAKTALDAPQTAALWMDGYHLDYVSGGKLVAFDFDGANFQTLASASPLFAAAFTANYHAYFALTAQNALSSTQLLTAKDQ